MDGEDKRYLGSSRAVFRIRAGLTFLVYVAIMSLMAVFLYRLMHEKLSTEGCNHLRFNRHHAHQSGPELDPALERRADQRKSRRQHSAATVGTAHGSAFHPERQG